MKTIMSILICGLCSTAATASTGPSFTCSSPNGKEERQVQVEYTNENTTKKVPCLVHYTKLFDNGERESKTPWKAANLEGFCERKAEELIIILEKAQFKCTPVKAIDPSPKDKTMTN